MGPPSLQIRDISATECDTRLRRSRSGLMVFQEGRAGPLCRFRELPHRSARTSRATGQERSRRPVADELPRALHCSAGSACRCRRAARSRPGSSALRARPLPGQRRPEPATDVANDGHAYYAWLPKRHDGGPLSPRAQTKASKARKQRPASLRIHTSAHAPLNGAPRRVALAPSGPARRRSHTQQ